jgi:ferric-dicitrate binding protein FerR (iron transport regulator)
MDRSTTAVFSAAKNAKKVSLKDGILFVTRKSAKRPGEQVFIDAPQASVAIDQGEVALVADNDQTIVEVAVGKVQLKRAADNKTITLSAGEYALVRPGKDLSAVHGRLQWKLERAAEPAQ